MATKSEWEITMEIKSWRMMPTWNSCTSSSRFRSRILTSIGILIDKFYLLYREQLQNNANKGSYFLKVDMDDLNNFDEQLSLTLRSYPSEYIPVVRKSIIKFHLVWKSSAASVQDSLFQLAVRRGRLCAIVPSANSQWWDSSHAERFAKQPYWTVDYCPWYYH